MPSLNLDLVRSIVAGWERGDFSSAEWAHPDVEFEHADGPSPGRWTGRTGLAQGTRAWIGAWREIRFHAEEYCELDDERVLVLVRFSGRGRTSGLDLDQMQATGANVFHVREGKVTRLVLYLDRDRALADLGLSPEGDDAP